MLKRYLKRVLALLGYEIRRIPERSRALGQNPFHDMKALTVARQSPIVFDVGANIGQTVMEFRQTFVSPIIHSFEPSPETFAQLLARVGAAPNFFPNNFALGAKSGSRIFMQNEHPSMSSFLELGRDGWGEIRDRKDLPISTIDDYIGTHNIRCIDILKSDTQGYELEVLKGAAHAFSRNQVHMVYVEIIFSDMYAGLPRFDEVCGLLLDNRFRLVSFYATHYQNGRASWSDALFINPEFGRPSS